MVPKAEPGRILRISSAYQSGEARTQPSAALAGADSQQHDKNEHGGIAHNGDNGALLIGAGGRMSRS